MDEHRHSRAGDRDLPAAHNRLDDHDMRIERIAEILGENPDPVAGVDGTGVRRYLHRIDAEIVLRRHLEERSVKSSEAFRNRILLLAAVMTAFVGIVSLAHTIAVARGAIAQPLKAGTP